MEGFDRPAAARLLRPRLGAYIYCFLFAGCCLVLGGGAAALPLFGHQAVTTYILQVACGLFFVWLGGWLIFSFWPGANALFLDASGFTYRARWRSQRHEWREVSRMIAIDMVFVGSAHPAGVAVTFRNQPYSRPLLIVDAYPIRRHDLLALMSSLRSECA